MGIGRPDCWVCKGVGLVRPRGGQAYECRNCVGVPGHVWDERKALFGPKETPPPTDPKGGDHAG